MARKNTTTTNFNETPRVRFNWGFWDARFDAKRGERDRRTIPAGEMFCLPTFFSTKAQVEAYAAGYAAGYDLGSTETDIDLAGSSEPAWLAYQEAKAIKA